MTSTFVQFFLFTFYQRNVVFDHCKTSYSPQKKAGNVARENLISLGTCFGKFTKTRKFRLHITSLDFLAPYASYKLWLKASAEQQFLYGHNVTKSGLGRITENTDKYQVLNVLTMDYLHIHFLFKKISCVMCPLGFLVASSWYRLLK